MIDSVESTGRTNGITPMVLFGFKSGCAVTEASKMLEVLPFERDIILYEPHFEKTGFLHLRKQRRRSASR